MTPRLGHFHIFTSAEDSLCLPFQNTLKTKPDVSALSLTSKILEIQGFHRDSNKTKSALFSFTHSHTFTQTRHFLTTELNQRSSVALWDQMGACRGGPPLPTPRDPLPVQSLSRNAAPSPLTSAAPQSQPGCGLTHVDSAVASLDWVLV